MNLTLRAHADARLADPDGPPGRSAADFSTLVNRTIAPRRRLGPGEIHVKAIYLISDARNAFGGRVPADELERLRDFCLNVPVLIGHQKQTLPVGRTFRTELVRKAEATWLKVWFYWLRDGGGDKLRSEIDGGIVSEASISFAFGTPECERCGKDFRFCPHDSRSDHSAGFLYRDIGRVLEISLVYRGAVPGTRIVDAQNPVEEYSGVKEAVASNAGEADAENDESSSKPNSLPPAFKLWYPRHEDALAYLSVCDGRQWRHWLIPQFSLPHLNRGARFVAQPMKRPPVCFSQPAHDSGLARAQFNARGHLMIECAGRELCGHFIVRRTRINRNGSDIIYRVSALDPTETHPNSQEESVHA